MKERRKQEGIVVNYYFAKWIGSQKVGKWNVIQIIDGQARYFVLKTKELIPGAETHPFLSHGWIEYKKDEIWFTDGDDFDQISDWDKFEGILISF